MTSKDWVLNACKLSTDSSILLSDKETQTSIIYVINSVSSNVSPSRPLPKNIEATAKNDNVKTFEFCEVIQDPDDPDSVSIIKETFTEEVLSDSSSFFDTPTKNKYKYCKEVVQPYSKSYPNDCPIPNCKPKSDACKDLSDRSNQEVCLNDKMNCDKCKTTFVNPNSSHNCERKEDEKKSSSCSSIGSIKDKKPPCEKSPLCKSIDECKLKSCISACVKESLKIAKKGSATCLEKFEKVIGVKKPKECDDKPTYYVLEKSKSQTDCSTTEVPKKNSIQSIFESQSQTVANITCAIKGFMGTVYNKTKDAVNMIRTESCRHLGIGEEPGSSTKENKSEKKTKECGSIVSETKIQSLYDKIRGQTSEMEDSNEGYNLEKVLEPAKEVIGQVASVISSTVSVLRNTSFDKIADDILNARFNKSSPHDIPDDGKIPKKITQDHEPGTNASVFTMIKAKLLSMFSDSQQERCQDSDDSDDDENNAEKLFDKFCEQ